MAEGVRTRTCPLQVLSDAPRVRTFGLVATPRRTALLVARLIAEGYGEQNPAACVQMLRNARSTTYDIDTQLMYAIGLGHATEEECRPLIEQTAECGKVVSGLIRSIEGSAN